METKIILLNNKDKLDNKQRTTTVQTRLESLLNKQPRDPFSSKKPEPLTHAKLKSLGLDGHTPIYSSDMDGFALAFYHAYNTHGTLTLSPDHLLAHVVNQINLYVSPRDKEFRHIFSVREEGKDTITVKEEELPPCQRWSTKMWVRTVFSKSKYFYFMTKIEIKI